MRVLFHPGFPKDVRRFEAEYRKISEGFAARFHDEAVPSLEAVRFDACHPRRNLTDVPR
jgi:hypothetical protein